MRKVSDKDDLMNFLLSSIAESGDEMAVGVGQLLFEAIKGVQKQLHSCSSVFLPLLVGKLSTEEWLDNKDVENNK